MNEDPNPYQPPQQASAAASSDECQVQGHLPYHAVTKANGIIRDGKLAVFAVAFIPILGLFYIYRLVQWYQLVRQHPVLGLKTETGEHAELAKKFQSAWPGLLLAALLWPVVLIYLFVKGAFR